MRILDRSYQADVAYMSVPHFQKTKMMMAKMLTLYVVIHHFAFND